MPHEGQLIGDRGYRPLAGVGAGFLAPWWQRVVAYMVDGLVVAAVDMVLLLLIGVHRPWHTGHISTAGLLTRSLASLAVAALYFPPVMRRTNGQTLGKMLLGVRVIRTDGKPMDMRRAAWREVVVKPVLLGLLTVLGLSSPLAIIGYAVGSIVTLADVFWPLGDRENRALHDMLAGTRVVIASGRE